MGSFSLSNCRRQNTASQSGRSFRNVPRIETGFEYDAKSGAFEIPALLPGFYRLDVNMSDEQLGTCGSVNVVVSSRDVSDVGLILSPCLGGK
jgi:hypothetical protein